MGRHGRLQEWREGRLCVFLGEVTPELSLKGGPNGGDTIWAQGEAMQVKLIDKKQLVCLETESIFGRGGEKFLKAGKGPD